MLDLAVLGLLKDRPMHGYQLSKELSESLGGFWRVSYGSLYPTLRRLEREGSVETEHAEASIGRRKNVYRITPKGEARFEQLLQEAGKESPEDTKFRVRLAFFRYLKPETRIRLLERRRAYLEERLESIQAQLERTRQKIDAYQLAVMTHGQDAARSDIAWLENLIAQERLRVGREEETETGRRARGTKARRAVRKERTA